MNPSDSSVPETTPTPVDVSNQLDNTSTAPAANTSQVIRRMNVEVFNAVQEGNTDALTQHGDDLLEMLTPMESTVLHVYIDSIDYNALVTMCAEVVRMMLSICPRLLLQPNKHGDTALHLAARHGRAEIVQVLMQAAEHWRGDIEEGNTSSTDKCHKFLIRNTNKESDTALHEAVRFNHIDVAKILIEKDPEFEYPANDAGETPLFIAAERGYKDLVFEILDNCTSPSYQGPDGLTALHIAAHYGDQQMTGRLLEKEKTLALAAKGNGLIPLHYAAREGHVSIVKQILECDISTAYISSNIKKRTPVLFAAMNGHVDVMEQFLLYCPDSFELVDSAGWNALHYAISRNRYKVEEFIRKNPWLSSVLLNSKDSAGNAPLHLIAMSDKKYNGLNFVRDSRVDKMTFNNENMTALHIAYRNIDSESKEKLWIALDCFGARYSLRERKKEENASQVDAKGSDKVSLKESIHKEINKSHMVVSALIATVTFAAGFTVPGGYQSEKGANQGLAVLSKNAAFKAFIITNTLAMTMASCAVVLRFSLSILRKELKPEPGPYGLAVDLTVNALHAMVVAFVTGTYAVLGGGHESLGLAVAATVLGCFFYFGLFGFMFLPLFATLRNSVTKIYISIGVFIGHLLNGDFHKLVPKCKF